MQLFVLIMVNIAMFAIFYLLISLKLERKATEFREKRMRRIMEEMINEFNETAERNISILENRINTLRRLLKISGDVSSLDVRLADEMPSHVREDKKPDDDFHAKVFSDEARGKMVNAASKPNTGELLKALIQDGTDAITKTFTNILHRARSASAGDALIKKENVRNEQGGFFQKNSEFNNLDTKPGLKKEKATLTTESLNDEDLTELFSGAKDKYALVSDLYKKGYSIESISRSSGIPQGEIRLVLNLGMQ